MILSNVRSLAPKMDELRAITKTCFEYRESNLMVLTESWLHEGIPDSPPWELELRPLGVATGNALSVTRV